MSGLSAGTLAQRTAQRTARQQRAWRLAEQAAELLRMQYGVQQVSVFGSLTHPDSFTQWSDVDVSACSPELLTAIVRDGVPL